MYFVAKIPTGNRLDCLAQRPHQLRPTTYLTYLSSKASGQLREKDESLVTFKRIEKQAADQILLWQSNVQRGNRIIVIKTFFATPFSDLFRLKINYEILQIDRALNVTLRVRKQLLRERIRDHITHMLKLLFMS